MLSFDDISKSDFFDCKHCHQPIPFPYASALYGIILLFGQENGYLGTVCPACYKTNLRKSSREDTESVKNAFNHIANAKGIGGQILRYYYLPHSAERTEFSIIPREVLREDYFSGTWEHKNRFQNTKHGHESYYSYLYGDKFIGPGFVQFQVGEDVIDGLIEKENQTGQRSIPRYMIHDEFIEEVENFCWHYHTSLVKMRLTTSGFEPIEENGSLGQPNFNRDDTFVKILCKDLGTETLSYLLPSSLLPLVEEFDGLFQVRNTFLKRDPETRIAGRALKLKEQVEKIRSANGEEVFQDQLSILSQRFVLEYCEKSSQTTFSKETATDLRLKYLKDIYRSIKSHREWNSIRLQAPESELKAVQEIEARFPSFKKIISADAKINYLKIELANPRLYQNWNRDFLIMGETGTGKELFAEAIHDASGRKGKYVRVNCAAIPENLAESELFGHKKWAFTDAKEDRVGYFEEADGGTLLLDEIGELPENLQTKLLRVIQEREIQPGGVSKPKKIDVIVVFATNRNLAERVEQGKFREDLYHRINIFTYKIPPLRERKQDIPLLVKHFIAKCERQIGGNFQAEPLQVTGECMEYLMRYHWPGNVRQIENTVLKVVARRKDGDRRKIHTDEIPEEILGTKAKTDESAAYKSQRTLVGKPEERDEQVRYWMEKLNGNKSKVAEKLGVTYKTILRRCKKIGI